MCALTVGVLMSASTVWIAREATEGRELMANQNTRRARNKARRLNPRRGKTRRAKGLKSLTFERRQDAERSNSAWNYDVNQRPHGRRKWLTT